MTPTPDELAEQVAAYEREHERKSRHDRRWGRAAALLALVCLIGGGYGYHKVSGDVSDNKAAGIARGDARDAKLAALRADVAKSNANYIKLYDAFLACTKRPDNARCTKPPTPTPSKVVAAAPTVIIHREVISGTTLRLAATQAARAALAASCGTDGCKDGKDGKDGADGTSTGVPGPEGPAGPAGPPGATGDTGASGRGIVSGPTCNDDGTWTTTYDQPPYTVTQDGPCRVVLLPPIPLTDN